MSKAVKNILLRKVDNALWAADPVSDEYVRQIGPGKEIMCKPWYPRNPKFHRFCMAYLHLVAENQDRFADFEEFMDWIKIKTGHFTIFAGLTGDTYRLADSIGFDAMDEVHFRRFMRRCEHWIAEELIPGFDLKAFDAEALRVASSYDPER